MPRICRMQSFAPAISVVLILALTMPPIADAAPPPPPAPVPAVPVLAAAAAIISIAADIKKMFDADDIKRTQQEILNRLGEIQKKLDEMDTKLDTIIARFNELEFRIDQKFEEQRTIDVITTIKRINQHYASWTDKNYKPGKNPSIPDPAAILEELRKTTTALRESSHANFSTVAMAMGYERLILTRVLHVKPNDADMQRGFAQYAAYFQDSASAAVSPRLVRIGERWVVAQTDWTAFQTAFNQRPRPLRCYTGAGVCCNPDWWYIGKIINRYDGDLLKGFTMVAEESQLTAGPGGTAKMFCYNSDHPVFPRRVQCPANVGSVPGGSCDLEQQHQIALAKKQVVDDLDAALDALRTFNDQAQDWAGPNKIPKKFPDPRPKLSLDQVLQKQIETNPSLKPPDED
jgi:hypothetical protein